MNKFELAPLTAWKKDHHGIGEIDYTLLLAHVFGKPIKAEQAFMYLFRRYGLPNALHDDYKNLCAYSFYTDDEDILVLWRITQGDYHFHLCAFAKYADWYNYREKPDDEWHKKIQDMAEKDGLVYFGGYKPYTYTLWKKGDGDKLVFVGNDIQDAAIGKLWGDCSKLNLADDEAVWDKVFDRMSENDEEICEKYRSVLPRPVLEWINDKPFCFPKGKGRQVEAGKEQHEWIMSLPEDHFLRRVYFTAMRLFEDWKKPTYIRDQYFNLDCEDYEGEDEGVSYTDFSEQIGGRNSEDEQ